MQQENNKVESDYSSTRKWKALLQGVTQDAEDRGKKGCRRTVQEGDCTHDLAEAVVQPRQS